MADSAGQLGTARFLGAVQGGHQSHGEGERSDPSLRASDVPLQDERSKGTPQFGLIAEEVEKVNPDLVVRDEEGKPYTVRYDAVNAMLLNEFLKEHRKVKSKSEIAQAKVAQQQKEIEALTARLKEQARKSRR